MQDWDTTLKLLIAESAESLLPILGATAGVKHGVKQWLNVELPKTQNLRVDLLAELESGQLWHIELQSSNHPDMPFRMLEYGVAIYRREGRFPVQLLVYAGNDPFRMQDYLCAPGIDFRFEVIDLKMLDGAAWLQSEKLSDNLLALLMALPDKREAIRRIVGRIIRLDVVKREAAFNRLLLTCGMRKLSEVLAEEIKKMPVTFDLAEDPVFGPSYRGGLQEGRDLGRKELMRSLMEKRFGPLPAWVDERLLKASGEQIDELAMRILDCPTLDQLLQLI